MNSTWCADSGEEVAFCGSDLLAAAGNVGVRRREEGDPRLVGGLLDAEEGGSLHPKMFHEWQDLGVVHLGRQLGTFEAAVRGANEDGWVARGDEGDLDAASVRHLEFVGDVSGGQERLLSAWLLELYVHGGLLSRNASQRHQRDIWEVVQRRHGSIYVPGHMDAHAVLLVDLPDADVLDSVCTEVRLHQALRQSEQTNSRREIPATAAPGDVPIFDFDLTEQVVHIVARDLRRRDNGDLAGRRDTSSDPVQLDPRGIWRPYGAEDQRVEAGSGRWDVLGLKVQTLRSAPSEPGGAHGAHDCKIGGGLQWM
mmetsp:Transcript_57159/g.121542  ORF Transcript_57159/g.121542 Transcript_57159/m.121542 type:complete len:310 (-) Transcript_57159:2-931(-)